MAAPKYQEIAQRLVEEIAEQLELPAGSSCHLLRRRSFTEDLPAAWGAEWVPLGVVPS